jgi:quercetin dioxygenase-like cupin family protein
VSEKLIVKRAQEAEKAEVFGEVVRRVLFSPETTGNRRLKMAYLEVPPGSQGTAHLHLGEEVVYTISGRATLAAGGEEYLLEPGTCCLIPPGVAHPARVHGDRPWVAVAAYCDECPVLKAELGAEGREYPRDA